MPGQPITIRAQHDGKAIIDGEYERIPVKLGDTWPGPIGEYFVIEGIVARNSPDSVIYVRGDHNKFRRVSAYNANTDENSHVYTIWAKDTLLEDCVAAGTGRDLILIYQTEQNVIRRCFTAWTQWDGRNFCGVTWPNGNNVVIYNASNNLIENSIAFGSAPGAGFLVQANADQAVANNNRVLGSMAVLSGMNRDGTVRQWGSTRPKPTTCDGMTDFNWPGKRVGFFTWGQGTLLNNTWRDIFASDNAGLGFSVDRPFVGGARSGTLDRATIRSNGIDAPDSDGGAGSNIDQDKIDFLTITNSKIEKTKYNGEGATIQNRYVNGTLTDTPLWPWPMESRIRNELGINVTQTMAEIMAAPIGFRLATMPKFHQLYNGQTGTVRVDVTSTGGFAEPVTVRATTSSPDVAITPANVTVNPPGAAEFTLRNASASNGADFITVDFEGVSGNDTQSLSVTVLRNGSVINLLALSR
ncbi:MAG: hypothetical protein IPK16_11235 [Anaerolineales bacterium]|nr:hypothetical protein [Anaerolineales bacterium]